MDAAQEEKMTLRQLYRKLESNMVDCDRLWNDLKIDKNLLQATVDFQKRRIDTLHDLNAFELEMKEYKDAQVALAMTSFKFDRTGKIRSDYQAACDHFLTQVKCGNRTWDDLVTEDDFNWNKVGI